jgi:DNA-binding XRE family transcriptional regulator
MSTTRAPIEVMNSLTPELQQVLYATSVLSSQFAKLGKQDRADLIELIGCLGQATDQDERVEIQKAMLEIMADKATTTSPMDLHEPVMSSNWAKTVGAKIRSLRSTANITQQQLAKKAGLQQSHVSRIESSEYSPTHMTLCKIAKVLNVAVEEFE